jgi:hypothetical protein
MSYTIILYGAGGELERKTGDDIGDILREYADEGSLSDGDTIKIFDTDDLAD